MKLKAGQQHGQWLLKGETPLGKGGNGIVWEATNLCGQNVAIKFLQSTHFGKQREKRFRSEIEFLEKEGKRSYFMPAFRLKR